MKVLFESAFNINRNINKLVNQDAINSFGKTLYQGDNANYAISLFQNNLIEPNESVKIFLQHIGQALINWAKKNISNGYFEMVDVHHGTELFLGFLPRYIDTFPDDEDAKNLILDVAEHIGNWRENSHDWFDYKNNSFKSWNFGTNGIHHNTAYNYNTADHLRLVHIALLAWEISLDNKYLEWSYIYSSEFAKRIIQAEKNIPVAWNREWKEFFPENMLSKEESFLAANQHHLQKNPVSGIENLLASGAIYTFGYLYLNKKDKKFKDASKIILNNLLPYLTNPYSDTIGVLFNYYRSTFNDNSFDQTILSHLEKIPLENENEIMLGFPENEKVRLMGVGNRKDMIYWYQLENLEVKHIDEPPTSFFMLAYNITGKIEFAERALKTASRKLKIASSILRSGHEHSDSGKLLSSVISGHGRNWGVGAITGCYPSLIIGSDENLGIYNYNFKFLSKTLSSGCLPLVRSLLDNKIELLFYNFSNVKQNIRLVHKKTSEQININLEPNSFIKKIFNK